MKEIIVDGNAFDNKHGFYEAFEKALMMGDKWEMGHNLDAFNDVLRGGFGVHEYGEKLVIRWINIAKSRAQLGDDFIDIVISIIEDVDNSGHNCELIEE